jgi:hypothetical protein
MMRWVGLLFTLMAACVAAMLLTVLLFLSVYPFSCAHGGAQPEAGSLERSY